MNRYVFINRENGEVKHADETSRNRAARSLGWAVNYGDNLPQPWALLAVFEGNQIVYVNEDLEAARV